MIHQHWQELCWLKLWWNKSIETNRNWKKNSTALDKPKWSASEYPVSPSSPSVFISQCEYNNPSCIPKDQWETYLSSRLWVVHASCVESAANVSVHSQDDPMSNYYTRALIVDKSLFNLELFSKCSFETETTTWASTMKKISTATNFCFTNPYSQVVTNAWGEGFLTLDVHTFV